MHECIPQPVLRAANCDATPVKLFPGVSLTTIDAMSTIRFRAIKQFLHLKTAHLMRADFKMNAFMSVQCLSLNMQEDKSRPSHVDEAKQGPVAPAPHHYCSDHSKLQEEENTALTRGHTYVLGCPGSWERVECRPHHCPRSVSTPGTSHAARARDTADMNTARQSVRQSAGQAGNTHPYNR